MIKENQRERFLMYPGALATDEAISALAKLTYLFLLNCAFEGEARLSYKTLARHMNCGRTTVAKAMTELKEAGYVEAINGKGFRGQYRLTSPGGGRVVVPTANGYPSAHRTTVLYNYSLDNSTKEIKDANSRAQTEITPAAPRAASYAQRISDRASKLLTGLERKPLEKLTDEEQDAVLTLIALEFAGCFDDATLTETLDSYRINLDILLETSECWRTVSYQQLINLCQMHRYNLSDDLVLSLDPLTPLLEPEDVGVN